MANYKTGAQRYNDRMDKIWEEAMVLKRRYCKHQFAKRTYNLGVTWSDGNAKFCKYCGAKK